MNPNKKVFFTFLSFVLAMLVVACLCSPTPLPPTVTSTPPNPMPSLAGTWHTNENAVIEIAWQGGQYVVVSYTWQGTSYDITSQSWTGSSLTWSLYDSDAGLTYTFTTLSLSGDSLEVNVSLSDGRSATATLQRGGVSSVTPELINTAPPPIVNPMPELEGYWQISNIAYTIAWQNGQYVVTSVIDSEEGSLDITSQSWDGSALTWTYYRPSTDRSITYTTTSVSGNNLFVNLSTSAGGSRSMTFHRVTSAQPSYASLPLYDDFSDPNSGWSIWEDAYRATGYSNGSYYVVSKSLGSATVYSTKFFGDTVIEVDATAVSGPAGSGASNNRFSYGVICRNRNGDFGPGYDFEIGGDGYIFVFYYTETGTITWLHQFAIHSSAINQGLATNHLVVTCAGSQLKMEVNGQVVFEVQDTIFSEGDIALTVAKMEESDTPVEVHFDNLVVRAP